jgi:hypothetical protein
MRKPAAAFPTWIVAVVAGIAIGYAIGVLRVDETRNLGEPSSAPEPVASNSTDAQAPLSEQFAALQRKLDGSRREEEKLALELDALRERLRNAVLDASAAGGEVFDRDTDQPGSIAAADDPEGTTPAARALAEQRKSQAWFDVAALEAEGFSSSEIEEIRRFFESLEMAKLYLADQSRRDGTFRTAAYNTKLAKLNQELREDLGVDGYDAFLYATGKHNRVEVQEVLDDSPASYAGLSAGDVVISYSGTRVFHPRAFKRATGNGDLGSQVSLEVMRDGELYRLSVPRGPLGIRMRRLKQPPLKNW